MEVKNSCRDDTGLKTIWDVTANFIQSLFSRLHPSCLFCVCTLIKAHSSWEWDMILLGKWVFPHHCHCQGRPRRLQSSGCWLMYENVLVKVYLSSSSILISLTFQRHWQQLLSISLPYVSQQLWFDTLPKQTNPFLTQRLQFTVHFGCQPTIKSSFSASLFWQIKKKKKLLRSHKFKPQKSPSFPNLGKRTLNISLQCLG